MEKETKKEEKKCWNCRKVIPSDGRLFCEDCEDNPEARKAGSVLVIYDKI